MIKRLLKAMDLDEARWPPRQAQWFINGRKDEGVRPQHMDDGGDPYQRTMIRIYSEYQAACERGGVVDFAELLLRAHELLRDRPDILHHYRERFQHILVDEFQDTNTIQYAWLRLLAGEQNNLFAVGDDDQSIYGWRGARVEHIRDFRKHFPTAPLLRLEQNYRSTATILKAANAVIANNPSRLGKELWTHGSDGEPILLYNAFNEVDEARFVVERVRHFTEEGHRRDECAILYRSNAQSRQFEEALIQAQLPTGSMAACAFLSAPRSRMPSPICVCWPIPRKTHRLNGRSISRPVVLVHAPWMRCVPMPVTSAAPCGRPLMSWSRAAPWPNVRPAR